MTQTRCAGERLRDGHFARGTAGCDFLQMGVHCVVHVAGHLDGVVVVVCKHLPEAVAIHTVRQKTRWQPGLALNMTVCLVTDGREREVVCATVHDVLGCGLWGASVRGEFILQGDADVPEGLELGREDCG